MEMEIDAYLISTVGNRAVSLSTRPRKARRRTRLLLHRSAFARHG
jgi:hypothetical protein